jgi:hypothetical protein
VIGPEYTKTDASVTIHLFGSDHVAAWLDKPGFELVRRLPFPMYLDGDRKASMPAVCYVARRKERAD